MGAYAPCNARSSRRRGLAERIRIAPLRAALLPSSRRLLARGSSVHPASRDGEPSGSRPQHSGSVNAFEGGGGARRAWILFARAREREREADSAGGSLSLSLARGRAGQVAMLEFTCTFVLLYVVFATAIDAKGGHTKRHHAPGEAVTPLPPPPPPLNARTICTRQGLAHALAVESDATGAKRFDREDASRSLKIVGEHETSKKIRKEENFRRA